MLYVVNPKMADNAEFDDSNKNNKAAHGDINNKIYTKYNNQSLFILLFVISGQEEVCHTSCRPWNSDDGTLIKAAVGGEHCLERLEGRTGEAEKTRGGG